ncbi:hypothetical protein ACQZV8_20655 [Magnetococcales bacterium HHB-1]
MRPQWSKHIPPVTSQTGTPDRQGIATPIPKGQLIHHQSHVRLAPQTGRGLRLSTQSNELLSYSSDRRPGQAGDCDAVPEIINAG